jgi:hypothetical protein
VQHQAELLRFRFNRNKAHKAYLKHSKNDANDRQRTNSVTTRLLTVGLQIFASSDQGVDWFVVTAATLMTSAPLPHGLPAVPAPVRAKLHARGNSLIGVAGPNSHFAQQQSCARLS